MKIITSTAEELYHYYVQQLALIQSKYQHKQSSEFLLEDEEYASLYDKAISSYLKYQIDSGEYDYSFITEEDHGILYSMLSNHFKKINSDIDNVAHDYVPIAGRVIINARKYIGKIIEKDILIKLEEIEIERENKRDYFNEDSVIINPL